MPDFFTFDDQCSSVSSEEDEHLFLDVEPEDDNVLSPADEDIGMAFHDVIQDNLGKFPAVGDWKDEEVGEVVAVTLGRGTHDVWTQAKEELGCARSGFEELLGTKRPSMEQIVSFFTGLNSELFRVISDELSWTYDDFCLFLKTFCVQSAYKISATELFHNGSYIKSDGLMEETDYVARWKVLGEACLPDDEKASPATRLTLWMKVEAAVNKMLRSFVVEPWIPPNDAKRLEICKIVFDDNKMWFDARASNAQLKISQHVRDYRRGPVHHDAVSSATSQLPASLSSAKEIRRFLL